MKNVILLLLSVCGMLACTHTPKWELVWEDNFDGAEPDTTIWSRIPRGRPDWQNTQSFDNRCYEMRDGCLILKGIVNDNMDVDTAKYLTGGLWTKDKHAFHRGRIEVRARLHGARGAWPAIWTLPYEIDKYVWPMGGEVDIMERLNYDSVYPRIETEQEGQFPFDIPQYLLIDMQLGGTWVGPVDSTDLPVEMEVDWVRHYQWK